MINTSLKLAYELTNPVIDEIITNEKTLFHRIGKSLDCFNNNNERFMEIKNNLDNPNINKGSLTYDPLKYMNEKDLKKISLNRRFTNNILPRKKVENQNNSEQTTKKNNLFARMTQFAGKNNDNNINTINNYNNIYTNSRLTNSFGQMTQEQLNEFYSFEDDFD